MLVSSAQLEDAAATVRRRNRATLTISDENVAVSCRQLDTAARILREASPSVCNGAVSERPGFIEERLQDSPDVLVFQMGILPSMTFRIDRAGNIEGHDDGR